MDIRHKKNAPVYGGHFKNLKRDNFKALYFQKSRKLLLH